MRFASENVNSPAVKFAILFGRKVDEMWPIDLLLPLARHLISELRHVRESPGGWSEKTVHCVGCRKSVDLIGRPSIVFVALESSLIIALVTCRLLLFLCFFDGPLEEEGDV